MRITTGILAAEGTLMMRRQHDPWLHPRESTLARQQPLFQGDAQAGGERHITGASQLFRQDSVPSRGPLIMGSPGGEEAD